MARMIRRLPADWRVALWALDAPHPRLESHTVGSGPGTKFELLNRLYAHANPPADFDVVVTDDDVVFRRGGSLQRLVTLVHSAGLSLAMPAHGKRSPHSFGITEHVPGAVARSTTFVEIGPLVVFTSAIRPRTLPFPEDIGMGWGLELSWHDLLGEGYRLGIVDALPIRHLGLVGVAYDEAPERTRLMRIFEERGITHWHDVQRVLGEWRQGEPTPPWLS